MEAPLVVGAVLLLATAAIFGFIAGANNEARWQKKREAERKRKSRAKLKARKLVDAAFVPCGGRELFTK